LSIYQENPMNPMQPRIAKVSGIGVVLSLLTAMPATAALIVVSGSGTSDPASIQFFVATFQSDLGGVNNGNALMSFPTGRRENQLGRRRWCKH
jgi:hypothetical protein